MKQTSQFIKTCSLGMLLFLAASCTGYTVRFQMFIENLPLGATVLPCMGAVDKNDDLVGSVLCEEDAYLESIAGGYEADWIASEEDMKLMFPESLRENDGIIFKPYVMVNGTLYKSSSHQFNESESETILKGWFVISNATKSTGTNVVFQSFNE